MAGSAAKKRGRGKSPLALGKLKRAMEDCARDCERPLNIDLVIDVTASDELINCLLEALRTQDPRTQLRCVLLAGELPELPAPCDLCVVAGGESLAVGEVLALAEELPAPAVLVIEEGETFFAQTPEQAAELAGGSCAPDGSRTPAPVPLDAIVAVDLAASEPLAELGEWVARCAGEARLALAQRYPFCREQVARELVRKTALLNAGVGVLIMMPGADMPVITLNQAKMVVQIAGIYGQPLDLSRLREVAAVVAGAFGLRGVARELADALPGLGWGVKGAVAYSGTVAMGRAAIDCFSEGGTLNSLGAAITRAAEQLATQAQPGTGPAQ